MATTKTIPLLVGSKRDAGNGVGIANFVCAQWRAVAKGSFDVQPASKLMPNGLDIPEGPWLEEALPHQIRSSADYRASNVQAWSKLVKEAPAIFIVTPQYNWSVPGTLKNTLDQLYNEWEGKLIFILTYGGHGGVKAAGHLKEILQGGLKAKVVVEPVMTTLPAEYIRTSRRIEEDGNDALLHAYVEELQSAFTAVLQAIQSTNSVE